MLVASTIMVSGIMKQMLLIVEVIILGLLMYGLPLFLSALRLYAELQQRLAVSILHP
jgi:hypothetical protein